MMGLSLVVGVVREGNSPSRRVNGSVSLGMDTL